MADFILNTDITIFYFINEFLSNSFLDKLMPFITDVKNWYILYFFLFSWMFWKGNKIGRLAALTLILTIALTDQINSMILKDIFERIRPCSELDNVRILVNCGSSFSFPSSHAANSFASAIILSYSYRQYKYVYLGLAILIAFSRVYVGVHYPIDVIAGALVGCLIASLMLILLKYFVRKKE